MNAAVLIIRFAVPGWHCWPRAPRARAYLGHRHRHLFHVEVRIAVPNDERAVEFHDLRDFAAGEFERMGSPVPGGVEFDDRSCETLARLLGSKVAAQYGRAVDVAVLEDGEFGATVCVGP